MKLTCSYRRKLNSVLLSIFLVLICSAVISGLMSGCNRSENVSGPSQQEGVHKEKSGNVYWQTTLVTKTEIADKRITETSGLTLSRRERSLVWTHNDSGNPPEIYALTFSGELKYSCVVPGARNIDWEDISSCEDNGKAFLLVADTGNNSRKRDRFQLYYFPEPDQGIPGKLVETRKLEFSYEGSSPDCEGVSIDPKTLEIYLISKTAEGTAAVYFLPSPHKWGKEILIAEKITNLSIPAVTGFEFSLTGEKAIFCTYGPAFEYIRKEGTSWMEAFSGEPCEISLPTRPQGEAVCYSADGKTLFLTSEIPSWIDSNVMLYTVKDSTEIGESAEDQ